MEGHGFKFVICLMFIWFKEYFGLGDVQSKKLKIPAQKHKVVEIKVVDSKIANKKFVDFTKF